MSTIPHATILVASVNHLVLLSIIDKEDPENDREVMNSLDEIGRRLWDVADWMEARNDLAQEALVEAARNLLESASGLYRMQPHFTIICPGGCQL